MLVCNQRGFNLSWKRADPKVRSRAWSVSGNAVRDLDFHAPTYAGGGRGPPQAPYGHDFVMGVTKLRVREFPRASC